MGTINRGDARVARAIDERGHRAIDRVAELEEHVGIIGRNFGQILVGLDHFRVVLENAIVARMNQEFFRGWQSIAQRDCLSRRVFGVIILAEFRIGLSELRKSEREVWIFLGGGVELFHGIEKLALALKLKPLVVIA